MTSTKFITDIDYTVLFITLYRLHGLLTVAAGKYNVTMTVSYQSNRRYYINMTAEFHIIFNQFISIL